VSGTAELALNVDAEGNLKDVRLVSEYPPLLGFGDAAVSAFQKAKFIPAFRDGQPVESKVTLPVYFTPSK
jgi:TonB family protein